jgi:hypothetical protein
MQALPPAKGYARRAADRTGYLTPAGKLPSVTTVIGETKSQQAKDALANWKERMKDAPEALQKAAARRGSWTHLQAENWILQGRGDLPGPSKGDLLGGPHGVDLPGGARSDLPGVAQRVSWGGYWRSLQGWLEGNFHSALAIEKPIWHPAGFSGTFDCLGWTYDSTDVALFDWKTRGGKAFVAGEERVRDYEVQLAAYCAGISWTYGIEVNRAHLVIAYPNGPSQHFLLDAQTLQERELEFFARLEIYQKRQAHVLE